MLELIIQQDSLGEIVRIGLYEDSKWLKWIPKKKLDQWVDKVDKVSNMNI